MIGDDAPRVGACSIARCAFNREQVCHARSVTIGDGQVPRCDTFYALGAHVRRGEVAGVGACKTLLCVHNRDLACQAPSISVDLRGSCAACMIFKQA